MWHSDAAFYHTLQFVSACKFFSDVATWPHSRVVEATEQAAHRLQREKEEADAAEAALQQQVSHWLTKSQLLRDQHIFGIQYDPV